MADAEMKSKVLLVDDDEQILRSLRVYLELEKYQVDTARNGKEALERLEESKPEIMVLDIMILHIKVSNSISMPRTRGSSGSPLSLRKMKANGIRQKTVT